MSPPGSLTVFRRKHGDTEKSLPGAGLAARVGVAVEPSIHSPLASRRPARWARYGNFERIQYNGLASSRVEGEINE